jgi:hypothetical protein
LKKTVVSGIEDFTVNFRGSYLEEPELGEGIDKRILRTVVIYEGIAAGMRARWFCERLAHALDCTLEEKMWNFDVLGIREVRMASAIAGRKGDILIVSVSGDTELPGTIRVWLDMWLLLLSKKKPALVGLFNSTPQQKIESVHSYLSTVAERGGMGFFPREMSAQVCYESVLTVRGLIEPITAE